MSSALERIRKPRCVLLYALAPPETPASEANRAFNAMLEDPRLPLVIFHDHFIGTPGGLAIFYAETAEERQALLELRSWHGWTVELRPLIYAHSPAALDAQIAFTLRVYRGVHWESLRRIQRPRFGDPGREAETAEEDPG